MESTSKEGCSVIKLSNLYLEEPRDTKGFIIHNSAWSGHNIFLKVY